MVGNYSGHTILSSHVTYTLTFIHIFMQPHLHDIPEMHHFVHNTEAMGMFLFPGFKLEHPGPTFRFSKLYCRWKQHKR